MDQQVDKTMELANSGKFDEVVTNVFEHLAESFPVAVKLDASVAGFEVVGGWQTVDTNGLNELVEVDPSADEIFFGHCVHWLVAEDYLRVESAGYVSFGGVVLTQKALTLINGEPTALKRGFY